MRASTFLTVVAYHWHPRAVSTPRAFRASASDLRLVSTILNRERTLFTRSY